VGVIKAPKQKNGQFRPLRLRKAYDRFSYLGKCAHGIRLPYPTQNPSPIFLAERSKVWHRLPEAHLRLWLKDVVAGVISTRTGELITPRDPILLLVIVTAMARALALQELIAIGLSTARECGTSPSSHRR
jgi:hypothetical protein